MASSERSRLALIAGLALAALGVFLFWPRAPAPPGAPPPPAVAPSPAAPPGSPPPPSPAPGGPGDAARFDPAAFPIAAQLNAADGSISRDLDLLNLLFDAWRSNFPHEGNPVGENAEITAALAGRNRLGCALLPTNHPALNARGELCDRWGTPFRFHQLGGERMEIRSAGPDRRFATGDDAVWTPP